MSSGTRPRSPGYVLAHLHARDSGGQLLCRLLQPQSHRLLIIPFDHQRLLLPDQPGKPAHPNSRPHGPGEFQYRGSEVAVLRHEREQSRRFLASFGGSGSSSPEVRGAGETRGPASGGKLPFGCFSRRGRCSGRLASTRSPPRMAASSVARTDGRCDRGRASSPRPLPSPPRPASPGRPFPRARRHGTAPSSRYPGRGHSRRRDRS